MGRISHGNRCDKRQYSIPTADAPSYNSWLLGGSLDHAESLEAEEVEVTYKGKAGNERTGVPGC